MVYPGDNSVKNLRALLSELKATLQRVKGHPIMVIETKERRRGTLKREIMKLVGVIYDSTDDLHLKAVVNSVFDSISVIDTIAELRGLNEGNKPQWYCEVSDD